VDYKNSFDKQVSSEAKIVFKLDRLVLDELTEDRLLSSYSCLVIDEAHERTISIDVIAGLIKDLVKARPDFKVIITSASMDVELFERYFGNIQALKVSGRLFDVNVQYR
jgi:HrpA-like RNA helicase